ncbi:hypothetical protein ACFSHQ_02230 [Gemmobacter lanyuensis]
MGAGCYSHWRWWQRCWGWGWPPIFGRLRKRHHRHGGALLALLGAGAAFLGAILAAMMRSWRHLRGVVTGLALLAATLTAVAAWFLMQNVLVIVMAVAALALLLDLAFTPACRG